MKRLLVYFMVLVLAFGMTACKNNTENGGNKESSQIVSSEKNDVNSNNVVIVAKMVAEGTIPKGCKYTAEDGKVYNEGDKFPSKLSDGDMFEDGSYIYKYNYVADSFAGKDPWIQIKSMPRGWGVYVAEKNRISYRNMYSVINGGRVTNIYNTFEMCSLLEKAPKLSEYAENLNFAFMACSSLTEAPEIPLTVKDMRSTFVYCEKLEKAPKIPEGVVDMSETFSGCTALKSVENIPSTVKDLNFVFANCTNLSGRINIDANADIFDSMFETTVKEIEIAGKSSKLINYALTAKNQNVTVFVSDFKE